MNETNILHFFSALALFAIYSYIYFRAFNLGKNSVEDLKPKIYNGRGLYVNGQEYTVIYTSELEQLKASILKKEKQLKCEKDIIERLFYELNKSQFKPKD